ncbi:ABC transporter substrate-binding protein [Paracoccus sediminicola]|uniref:ABC transporter substrate-binding protein n=1 Tax=Paracoccus sediminicola TaxID=3017783 RepID=UPI0022F05794|nr:ABC transporter substrate-binding protein [Paracoccus sediminicola]WBU57897.1 ABC transporter substrate-binding protein [Paracoccus sediminicola]
MTNFRTTLVSAALAALIGMPAMAEGTLTVAQRQDANNWDPIDTFLVAWSSPGGSIFDGLIRRDENLELQPGLATEWEVLEDGMRLRFKLREGVSFHNGEPFNAEAVKYTFDRLLGDEGAAGPQRSNYTSIESVEIVDDSTVEFVMNKPDPVMLTKLSGYGAMIVPPQYIEENGEEHFDLNPVGTGPFKFVSYEPSARLELEANPDYFDGAPELDKLIYRFIPEASTRLAELQSGGIDIDHNPVFANLPVLEGTDGIEVISVPGPTVYGLRFNTKEGITTDANVRRALIMATDRQALIDAFLGGNGQIIAEMQGPLSFGYDEALEPYPYDPEQAKQLLEEAGVEQGAEITIDYRASHADFGEVVQAMTGFFAEVGINASVNPVEDAVFLNELVPQGQVNELFEFAWGGWTFDYDNTAYLIYHDGEVWNPFGTTPEMNALLEEQREVADPDERLRILREIAEMAKDEAYHLPVYNENQIYAVSDRVEGFVPAPDQRVRYTEVSVTE